MNSAHALASLPQRVLLLGATASLLTVPVMGVSSASAQSSPSPHSALPASPSAPPACVLGNGGFEEPSDLRGAGNMRTDIPNWHTTSADRVIELWGPGNAPGTGVEVAADSGSVFAEMNGTQASTLYQDITTHPKTVLVWRLAHRARSTSPDNKDVIRVKIGAPGGETVQIPLGQTTSDIADGGTGWGHYTGIYRVPKGQKVTRFSVEAVSSAAGVPSYGNFLDSVEVTCSPPCPKAKFPHRSSCDELGLPRFHSRLTPPAHLTPQAHLTPPAHPASPAHTNTPIGTATDALLPRPAQ
ncbi:hypothetical protein [Sphaerisporangium perillae]|uniref:hypothetical protein n=1 Tax=Sphaerisporangium perillae TaxID=2935860 RepID=UPI00200E8794|nr:hypothetical protein [Sphaerisporangium perillae]